MIRVGDVVAKYVVDSLGVDTCFAVTGAGIMHLTDALACEGRLKTIFPHHEQTSSMAVDAYSRYTGKIGVAFFSTGPASTNAITGLAGCWQDSVASLFISGQVKRAESSYFHGFDGLRQFGVQELDILPIIKPVTKYSAQVTDPENILFELDKATHIAKSGRPGPVWLEIPMDVQAALVDEGSLKRWEPENQDLGGADHQRQFIENLLKALAGAEKPIIIAGQGVRLSGTQDLLLRLSEKTGLPFVTPYLGIDNFPRTHANFIGVTGVKGDRAANWAMQAADLLLVLGSSMHTSVTGYDYELFSQQSRKFGVDIDSRSSVKGNVTYEAFLEADLAEVLPVFAEEMMDSKLSFEAWTQKLRSLREKFPVVENHYSESDGLNIYKAIDMVNALLKPGDCVISDAGSAFYAVSQALRLETKSQRYLTSGAMATMGFSLPASIGVAVANCSRTIAFTGDGSLQQNLQELALLPFHKLNIKLIVLNNNGYLSIRASQKNYYEGRFFGTESDSGLPMPDLESLADAYGIPYFPISSDSDLSSLRRALDSEGPAIVDVQCPPNQAIVPSVGSKLLPDGSLVSSGLEDMNPSLDLEERKRIFEELGLANEPH